MKKGNRMNLNLIVRVEFLQDEGARVPELPDSPTVSNNLHSIKNYNS